MQEPLSSEVAVLVGRVTRLEQLNRRLWLVLVALGVFTLASFSSSVKATTEEPHPRIVSAQLVEAHSFVLMGENRSTIGEWRLDGTGGARLVLYDRDAQVTTELPPKVTMMPAER